MGRRVADVRDALRPAWYRMPLAAPRLELEIGQIRAKLAAEVGALEGELD
jgi:hypothetical protein